MSSIDTERRSDSWRSLDRPLRGRSFGCRCRRAVFFRSSKCPACGAPLGYEPLLGEVRTLVAGPTESTWRLNEGTMAWQAYRRCSNFDSPAKCNWLVPVDDPLTQCVSCRLNRTIPDQADADNRRYWHAVEKAKRRLVSQLLALGLPVKSKVSEDPEHGVAFDLLRPTADRPHVMTGHASGLITLKGASKNRSSLTGRNRIQGLAQ